MAGRPGKVGLDYFELDCHMEEKVRLIQAEFGLKGFAVVVKLYQKIYGELGYYCEWNEDSLLLFMSENGLPSDNKNLISEIVAACIRRNIFSERLFKEYGILTSAGVQKRYLNATSKRGVVILKKEYLLINDSKIPINVVINSISDVENSISDVKNSQSKEKESKEEKSKEVITASNDAVRRTDVQRAVDAWNDLAQVGIKKISRITSGTKRYQSLTARINEYGIEEVLAAISRIRNSDFLQGRNGKGWVITFDWFVLPNNFPKVYEGNYDSASNQSHNGQGQSGYDNALLEKLLNENRGDTH